MRRLALPRVERQDLDGAEAAVQHRENVAQGLGLVDQGCAGTCPRHTRHEARPVLKIGLGHRMCAGLEGHGRRRAGPRAVVGRIGDDVIEALGREPQRRKLGGRLGNIGLDHLDPLAKAVARDVLPGEGRELRLALK